MRQGYRAGLCVQCAEKARLAQEMPRSRHPKAANEEACEATKNKTSVLDVRSKSGNRTVRLMFEDEVAFG